MQYNSQEIKFDFEHVQMAINMIEIWEQGKCSSNWRLLIKMYWQYWVYFDNRVKKKVATKEMINPYIKFVLDSVF